jgi:hypothetical protein
MCYSIIYVYLFYYVHEFTYVGVNLLYVGIRCTHIKVVLSIYRVLHERLR